MLTEYWQVCPKLQAALFKANRPGYYDLLLEATQLKTAIHEHPQFAAFIAGLTDHFAKWRKTTAASLRKLKVDCHPKQVIRDLSENLLAHAEGQPLIDPYAIYQHLMDYWAETMQDDCYLISADGWVAATARIMVTDARGRTRDRGWICDLIPKPLIVARCFANEQAAIESQQAAMEAAAASLTELEEEHGGEEGCFGALEKIAKTEIIAGLKEIKGDKEAKDEVAILKQWLQLNTEEAELRRAIREAEASLDQLAFDKYPELSDDEIRTLVVDDKWLASLSVLFQSELDRVSQTLTGRIRQLAERYGRPLPQIVDDVEALSRRVDEHLKKMGASL